MDQATRNKLQKATQQIRRSLEAEFAEQLEGTYDILASGKILPEPGAHLSPAQRVIRQKLLDAIAHNQAAGKSAKEAIDDYTREAAFTFLNRFVALRMLEARGIVLECVSKGDQSSGFREFTGLAPGLASLPDGGYRLYLECLCDELSVEVKVLFDRRDPAGLLWPRRAALKEVLDTLGQPELAAVWKEDETIGWVYQYFNSPEERKQMRDESAAPRNSRELAVRNQFFTPRYVVEFLTDNTLGRIWYEMRQGQTRLAETCKYLVRRPSEVFLAQGETPPPEVEPQQDLSQAELLKRTVYIPHRPKKDPRDLKVLDPASGSGHFLLYSFDLLLAIYEEAYDDPELGPALKRDYPTLAEFRLDIPRLILAHNLHGIDIDLRATQIASLALWMRAQRAWQQAGVPVARRPAVEKSNIVCAEPMPGDERLLKEFIARLDPPVLGQLVEVVFDKMKLAGEAGSLLKIEEEIRDAVETARRQFGSGPAQVQRSLFGDPEPSSRQQRFDLSGVRETEFFEEAEALVLAALRGYAEAAQTSQKTKRRLFAQDAARGFAFIDLCRKRYDATVMNPPFGEFSLQFRDIAAQQFLGGSNDIITAFVERGVQLTAANGLEGVISSRTVFFAPTSAKWRQKLIVPRGVVAWVELGEGVLDGAMVEVCMYVVGGSPSAHTLFTRPNSANGEFCLTDLTTSSGNMVFPVKLETFRALTGWPFAYWLDGQVFWCLENLPSLERTGTKVRVGLQTGDDFRFIRQWAEVPGCGLASPDDWLAHAKGGDNSPYYTDIHLVVNWKQQGREVKAQQSVRLNMYSGANPDLYHTPGMTFSYRTNRFSPAALPANCITGVAGMGIFAPVGDLPCLLAFLNSSAVNEFISARLGLLEINALYQAGTIQPTPVPEFTDAERSHLEKFGTRLSIFTGEILRLSETSRLFVSCGSAQTSLRELGGSRSARLAKATQDALKLFDDVEAIVFNAYQFGQKTSEFISSAGKEEMKCSLESLFENALPKVGDVLSFAVGVAFGRWDIRYATGEKPAPELPDPFAPLPVCPPGQLQNKEGLPAGPGDVPEGYPVPIPWDGILVDDPNHPDDIVARTRHVMELIWHDKAADIEHEAAEILGVRELRDYYRKSAAGGFWPDHIKRYSKSRRKAPIYWQLATASGSYSVWLYYHRFTNDTFFKVLNEYARPKLAHERLKLDRLKTEFTAQPTRSQQKELEAQESLIAELAEFAEEIHRVAPLWRPNLNDGVIINFAPLWRLVPQNKPWQKECKACWDSLVKGEYDWAHLAMHLWPERVVPKCRTDASLAIAHGLEDEFWQKDARDRYQPKPAPECGWERVIEKLVAERQSPAVKAAVESLMEAPVAVAGGKGGRKRKGTA